MLYYVHRNAEKQVDLNRDNDDFDFRSAAMWCKKKKPAVKKFKLRSLDAFIQKRLIVFYERKPDVSGNFFMVDGEDEKETTRIGRSVGLTVSPFTRTNVGTDQVLLAFGKSTL